MNKKFRDSLLQYAQKLCHHLFSMAIFVLFYFRSYSTVHTVTPSLKADIMLCAAYCAIRFLFYRIYDAHSLGSCKVGDLVFSQSLSDFLAALSAYPLIAFVHMNLVEPFHLCVAITIQIAGNAVWSYLANRSFFARQAGEKAALLYLNNDDLERIRDTPFLTLHFRIEKYIRADENINAIIDGIRGMDSVLILNAEAGLRNLLVNHCYCVGIRVFYIPMTSDVILQSASHVRNISTPIFEIRSDSSSVGYRIVKRAFDAVFSLFCLVALSPLMVGLMLAIRLSDGGPALYRQTRLTRNAREFTIYKFRSMRVDAEKDGVSRLSCENDNRITPIGGILRRFRLDELPQLINIFKGEMSFVGPRPERSEIAAEYAKSIPDFPLRLKVKAGLTGTAQVYGKYNTAPEDKLLFDLMYINRMGIIEDMNLLFATVKILFKKESTSGVAVGATTAIRARKDESKAG